MPLQLNTLYPSQRSWYSPVSSRSLFTQERLAISAVFWRCIGKLLLPNKGIEYLQTGEPAWIRNREDVLTAELIPNRSTVGRDDARVGGILYDSTFVRSCVFPSAHSSHDITGQGGEPRSYVLPGCRLPSFPEVVPDSLVESLLRGVGTWNRVAQFIEALWRQKLEFG